MTYEEAISIMNVIIYMLEPQYDTERVEDAVEMSIRALKMMQGIEDAYMKELLKTPLERGGSYITIEEAIKELRDASDSEVRYGDKEHHYDEVMKRVEAFDMAIKALEQQPCEDCISREALRNLKVSVPIAPIFTDDNHIKYRDAVFYDDIIDLPSVNPQRKKGRWIEQQDIHKHHYGWMYCSECGAFLMSSDGANFCSCCGAEMEVDE